MSAAWPAQVVLKGPHRPVRESAELCNDVALQRRYLGI
jgi:hypothetical protein